MAATEQLGRARLALGEAARLVPELEELAILHPYREGLWALLMRALYASGRQADALAAYRALRGRLVEELGIEPSPELQDLELRILNQTEPAPVAASRPASRLPVPVSEFVGRAALVDEVAGAVLAARLVTVMGPAGVGKTRLAIEAARRVGDEFRDGVFFVDLAAVSDESDVPDAVAAALDLDDQSGRPAETVVAEHLADRALLLVLDNCEHVAGRAAALALSWLSRGEGLHVLASSQERLRIEGEHIVMVTPMATAGHDGDEPEAVRLFLTRAADQVRGFDPGGVDKAAIAEICSLLDGLPLAIELAASRVRVLSPADILSRLDDRFSLLTSQGRPGPERHRTLRAAVEWSYALLSEQERRAFDRLSILAGPFSLDAAEAIAGDATSDRQFVDLLQALVDRSLVATVPASRGTRYRMLETLRLFGQEQLRTRGELDAMERRRAIVFAGRGLHEAGRVRTDEFQEALARIDEDLDNLRQSFRWALHNGEHELAFDLTRPLWSLVYAGARRHLHEGSEWRSALIEATQVDHMRARLLAEQGFTLWLGGDQLTAVERAEESLLLAGDDAAAELLATEVLAMSAATNRETDRAVELARRLVESDDDSVDVHAFEALALAHIFGGQPQAAVGAVEEVFAAAERRSDPLRHIRALALMGAALQPIDQERSMAFLDEAVETTGRLGMDWDLAGAVMARAGTRLMGGDMTGGLDDLAWASELTFRVRDRRRQAQTLEVLGGVLARLGLHQQAARALLAAVELRRSAGVAGSEAQERDRRAALAALEAELGNGALAEASRWAEGVSAGEAASFGADAARSASDIIGAA
ncbi:MAG: BTAD domain-containing putative transcriptional regulator, partial [Thermoanaerobaculia bacterium]|nr:BTAD domain-containing putative transcriptional regulator [Thermoanaerobaculia bacterium]